MGQTLLRRLGVPLPTDEILHVIVAKLKPKSDGLYDTKKVAVVAARKEEQPPIREVSKSAEESTTKRVRIPKGVVLGEDHVRVELSESELAMCVDALPERDVRWLVPVPPANTNLTAELEILTAFKDERIMSLGDEQYYISEKEFASAKMVARTGNIINVWPSACTEYEFVEQRDSAEQQKLDLALLEASEKGETRKVKDLLNRGADADVKDYDGRTALMLATWNGHTGTARLLIERGADVNAKMELFAAAAHGETVLMIASFGGYAKIVELLIRKGAQVNSVDEKGRTARMHAAAAKKEAEKGRAVRPHVTVENYKAVEEILKRYEALEAAKSGARLPAEDREWLNVILLDIMRRGETQHIRGLLDSGADANVRDESGWRPIMWAAVRNQVDMVELLVERGADVNATNDKGMCALNIAKVKGNHDVVAALERLGAKPFHEMEEEFNKELIAAVESGEKTEVIKLLDRGADVNARYGNGETPLFWAAVFGKPRIMELLIERGADVNARDKYGRTPLMLAAWNDQIEAVKILTKNGADVNARDGQGRTVLAGPAPKK